MNSFMKAKKEAENISKYEVVTPEPLQSETVDEENKTSSTFTFKDFQKTIKEKDKNFKTSDISFPEELPEEIKLPLPTQDNPNSSLIVKKINEEKLNEELVNKEIEEEIEEEKEKEKETENTTENIFEVETVNEFEEEVEKENKTENIIETKSVNEFEEEIEKKKEKIYETHNTELFNSFDENYKIVKFKLSPFIFTEKYKKSNDVIQETNISCYSFLNSIKFNIFSLSVG